MKQLIVCTAMLSLAACGGSQHAARPPGEATATAPPPSSPPRPASDAPPAGEFLSESAAQEVVAALPEVREFIARARAAGRTPGFETSQSTQPSCADAGERCRWQFRAYEDTGAQAQTWRFFEVDPRTRAVRVMDPVSGEYTAPGAAPTPAAAPAPAAHAEPSAPAPAGATDLAHCATPLDLTVAGAEPATFAPWFDHFRAHVAQNDRTAVAHAVSFPLHVTIAGRAVTIANAAAFARRYDEIVTPAHRTALAAQDPCALSPSSRGIMVHDGEFWFAALAHGGYTVLAINPPVPAHPR